MNLTSESFVGIISVLFAVILFEGVRCNCVPYTMILVGIACMLFIKGVFLIIDDIKFKSKYLCVILSILFPLAGK